MKIRLGVYKIDQKFRLAIPSSLKSAFKEVVFLGTDKDGIIIISPKFFGGETNIYIQKIEKGKITIPRLLRTSTSFILGKRVMIVKNGGVYELWPWPE